jgi:hypothetical protein
MPIWRYTIPSIRRIPRLYCIARKASTATGSLKPADEIRDVQELDRLLELVRQSLFHISFRMLY